MSRNRMTRPCEMLRYLQTIMATMSVPPVLPPWVKAIPMAVPANAPPIREERNLSSTKGAISPAKMGSVMKCCKMEKNTEAMTMEYTVLMPNEGPNTFREISTRMPLMTKTEIPVEMPVA